MDKFYVNIGICGSISAGKSTLINALMGDTISDSGMSRTTSEVIKLNYSSSKVKEIEYHKDLTINIYDTPGNSDYELGTMTRVKSFLTLTKCHIIINVIDFLEAAKPTSTSLANVLTMLNKVNKKAKEDGIYQQIIHVVNKGDSYSSEYKTIFNKIKATIAEASTTKSKLIKLNASRAALKNYRGNLQNKEQLLRIINSVYSPPLTNTSLVTYTFIQEFVANYRQQGYEALIRTITNMLDRQTHLMCMSNCTFRYFNSDKKILDSLIYYDDLKEICRLTGNVYLSEYAIGINNQRECSECAIL